MSNRPGNVHQFLAESLVTPWRCSASGQKSLLQLAARSATFEAAPSCARREARSLTIQQLDLPPKRGTSALPLCAASACHTQPSSYLLKLSPCVPFWEIAMRPVANRPRLCADLLTPHTSTTEGLPASCFDIRPPSPTPNSSPLNSRIADG
jgi:hypothetical protein